MNKLTKKSFYSFLTLYLASSFIFLSLAAYWFLNSQIAMEKSNNFYKMNHVADTVSSEVIQAHMKHTPFQLQHFPNMSVALYDKNKKLLYGTVRQTVDFSKEFAMSKELFTLVSKRPAGHLGVEYIVVQSAECMQNIKKMKNTVAYVVIFTAVVILIIAIVLSYIFLKPLKDKMQEIENFVKDTSHELNTPISAIIMSTSRLKNKKVYDEKIVKNISISTKQLYDMYSALSYLSFDNKQEQAQQLDFCHVVEENIRYFNELLEKKQIQLNTQLQRCPLYISPTKAKMLVNNLLGNAIKYSKPNTTITITLTTDSFWIKDEGIGIAQKNQQSIFQRFTRANNYSGGFGVGLSIVKSIVDEYNFHITINSQEHQGTTVIINF